MKCVSQRLYLSTKVQQLNAAIATSAPYLPLIGDNKESISSARYRVSSPLTRVRIGFRNGRVAFTINGAIGERGRARIVQNPRHKVLISAEIATNITTEIEERGF